MSRVTAICMVLLLLMGYLGYDRFSEKRQTLITPSKHVLNLIAIKKLWVDPREMLRTSSDGELSYSVDIESAYAEADNVYAFGKILINKGEHSVCRLVDFNFKQGKLDQYEVTKQRDCR